MLQLDGPFRTSDDTQAAGSAVIGMAGIGGLSTMRRHAELADQAQIGEIDRLDPADLEDVMRAHVDAVSLRLAATVIDDGKPASRWCIAPLAGAIGVRRGSPLLVQVLLGHDPILTTNDLVVYGNVNKLELSLMQPEDLSLLVALNALLEEQSVTRAAERTNVSTPTMSRTLARLRRITGDPLLVRAGRTFVLTEHALEIAPDVRSAVELGVSVFRSPGTVDPSQIARVFTLRASDAFIGSFGGPLVSHLQVQAPLVSLRFTGEGTESAAELRDGHVDLDLGAVHELDDGLESEVLRTEFLSGVVRSGHPLTNRKVTPERLCQFGHLAVSRRGRKQGPIDAQLAELGLERQVAATVPDFYPALAVVSTTDLVTFAPTAIVARGGIAGVSTIAVPFDLPPIEVSQTWHRRFTHDPAHQWLRTCVREVCAT